ncbi:sensor histidine kinase [Thalassomonas haliotis]|uniref:histidine kinase n=1 Tax=Thalassomonas haliotis TaxID=485448 RepID=A0ABY7VD54_9GAMM|nr:HAMP domain-containing sensor histidine kinase [Thalassomonas haliotis]WDE11286.1 HAMP domain-containing histidine kinase [Thalassomonas haliotis]
MKISLYQRLAITLSFAFILMAYLLYWWSSELSQHSQHQAEQKLHLQLAEHLAHDNPLLQDGVYDKKALANLFHTLMLLGPSFEFYFLDPSGKILSYSADASKIKRQDVNIRPLLDLIENPQKLPLYGDDPRSTDKQKIFSVAPVYTNEHNTSETNTNESTQDKTLQGYLYVIIGGEIYDSVFQVTKSDQQLQQNIMLICGGLLLLLLLLLALFRYFTSPIRLLLADMQAIQQHKFDPAKVNLHKWPKNDSNEVNLLGCAFTAMVEQINAQLLQLNANERMRKELLAHLSHDLRTPLAAMQGYIETLAIKGDSISQQEREQYIATVLRNGKQLKMLIDQIFELAHLEDGQVSVNLETFPIGELLYDIVAKFSLKASEKNIRLTLNPQQCRYMVYSDIAKLERILTNLLENAIRHTPQQGEITLEVIQDKDKVKVSVIDTGTGISNEDIAYIFDPRYRASNATGDKKQHAGLGLAISKRLSMILNSELSVESKLGKGCRFSFCLQSVMT